jgi:hypothetical protein
MTAFPLMCLTDILKFSGINVSLATNLLNLTKPFNYERDKQRRH